MVEPKYKSLADLKADKKIPESIREIIFERHIRQRNQISQILGEIELSYRRGYQAGYEDMQKEIKTRKEKICLLNPNINVIIVNALR